MATTPESIVNLGFGRLGSSRVRDGSVATPNSPLERHVSEKYAQWRDSELTTRVWVFSQTYAENQVPVATLTTSPHGDGRIYKYAMPDDCLQVVREKFSEWEQRGLFLYSACQVLTFLYIRRALETEMPPAFIDVLASRACVESVEYITQSNTKNQTAEAKYTYYVSEARRQNAWVEGPADVRTADDHDEWITARLY